MSALTEQQQAQVDELYSSTYNRGMADAVTVHEMLIKRLVDRLQSAFAQLPERPAVETPLIITLDQFAVEYRAAIEQCKLSGADLDAARNRLVSIDDLSVDTQ